MFAIPGVLALIFLVYVHPQDIFHRLRLIPLFNYAFAAAAIGWIIDLRLRLSRLQILPIVGWSALFYGWALLTLGISDAGKLLSAVAFLAIPFAMFFIIAQGAHTFRALQTIAAVLIAVALYISVIGIHQQ